MRKKFITLEEYQKIDSESKITFHDKSPISSIFLPRNKLICYAMHRDLVVCGARETTYAIRFDPGDVSPINIDAYSYTRINGKDKFELDSRPIKNPLLFEQHKASDIPLFIKKQAPNWVKQRILEVLGLLE